MTYTAEEILSTLAAIESTPVYWEGGKERGWDVWRTSLRAESGSCPDIQIVPIFGGEAGELGVEAYRVINALTAPPRADSLDALGLLY